MKGAMPQRRPPKIHARTPARGALGSVALLLALGAAVPARAQPPLAVEPTRRLWALDLDGGATRDGDPARWRVFGRVGVGAARFDGRRLLSTTVELGVHGGSRSTLGLAGQLAYVQSGLGLTGTVLRDLKWSGFGAGLGASFSFLHAQAQWFTRGPSRRSLSLFLRAPLGLLWHLWRGRHASAGAPS
jgi:hypothetical protein